MRTKERIPLMLRAIRAWWTRDLTPRSVWGRCLFFVLWFWSLIDGFARSMAIWVATGAGWVARWAHDGGTFRRVIVCVGLLLLGVGFRWYRAKRQHAYGALEIACALTIVWFVVSQDCSREVAFASFMGALYVVVRGLDNFFANTDLRVLFTPATAPSGTGGTNAS